MEFFFLCGISLFIIIVSLSFVSLLSRSSTASLPNLPPGKMGLPVLGESLEFLSTSKKGYPEKFVFDRMAKYSTQIFKTSILGETAAVLCGAPGNKFLFSNENKLVVSWWPSSVNKIFPSSNQTSSKEESVKMRKMLPAFFKPEALQRYVGMMDAIARRHFKDSWEGKQEVTVFPLAKGYTFWVACKVFLSIEHPLRVAQLLAPFEDVASGVFSMPIDLPGTPFNRAVKASNTIRKELLGVIRQRRRDLDAKRASPTQDILSHMLVMTDENGEHLKEMDIADKILGLLIGGHDTASAAITFLVKYLSELPHIYEQVLKEQLEIAKSKPADDLLNWDDMQKMKYSWNVACEVIRLAPPVQGAFREALVDFAYAGFSIPKGWKLYWSAHTTHKNPECFPEPEKFDPSRYEGKGPAPYTFVPFGGGPRTCPGKEYARLEILVFIYNVVRRFKWEKIIPNEKIIVDPMPMPAKGLPVRLYPHKGA